MPLVVRPVLNTRAVDRVFVIGLAVEVAGAALLAADVLTRDALTVAARGMTFPSSEEPQREAQRDSARGFVGFVLLALGAAVQVVGYAVDGGSGLLAIAVEVFIAAFVLGLLVADGIVTSLLYRRAIGYWQRRRVT
jgi:hypothetical protein